MKEIHKDICMAIIAFFSAIIVFCMVVNIWNMDLSIPLCYGGDISGLLGILKAFLRDENWWNFDALGEPFGTNEWRQLWDGIIPYMIMIPVLKVTHRIGYGVNFYYIVSFGLSAICAYYMLRKCKVGRDLSFAGALVYAFIPGHIQRNEPHLFVGSCFAIPLIVTTGFFLYEGDVCKEKYKNKEKLSFLQLLQSNNKDQLLGLLFLFLVSLSTIYYGIFALMYLTFCTLMWFARSRKFRAFFYYIEYVVVELLCIVLVYLPKILADRFDPLMAYPEYISRMRNDVELYAGKMIVYILPIVGHRIKLLSAIRNIYDTSYFTLRNENAWSSLGLVMSIGFMAGIIVCFFGTEKTHESLKKYGKIELFFLLLSAVGGISAVVGLFDYNLRCYNRFSFFIGAVGTVLFFELIEWIVRERGLANDKKYYARTLFAIIVAAVAIYDQTSVSMTYSKEYGKVIKDQYESDEKFVKGIEEYEGENADILVFPVMNGQESAMGSTREGHQTGYCTDMLFPQSKTSDWSTGSKSGEKGERWKDWLEKQEEEKQIEIAAIAGFEGIAICCDGYEKELLVKVRKILRNALGKPDIVSKDGKWEYYSVADEMDTMFSSVSDEEMKNLHTMYVDEFDKGVAGE